MAQDYGHARIHALVAGDADGIEAMITEIVLFACTLRFGKPLLSLVCADPKGLKARLESRYPEISDTADLSFHTLCEPTAEDMSVCLEQVLKSVPVTAIYCSFALCINGLMTAKAISQAAWLLGQSIPPVFVRVDSDGGLSRYRQGSELPHSTATGRVDGANCPAPNLVPFGTVDDMARVSGFDTPEADLAEREYHKGYLRIAPASGPAALPWEELDEEYKVSNRRAVAHMYAKLFEAGFDLRDWMAHHNIWCDLPYLTKGEKLYNDDAMRDRLARLEHERWNNDRRMSGWRYGDKRDNIRKIHPNLTAFDELPENIQKYDVEFIDLLGRVLTRRRGSMRRATFS